MEMEEDMQEILTNVGDDWMGEMIWDLRYLIQDYV